MACAYGLVVICNFCSDFKAGCHLMFHKTMTPVSFIRLQKIIPKDLSTKNLFLLYQEPRIIQNFSHRQLLCRRHSLNPCIIPFCSLFVGMCLVGLGFAMYVLPLDRTLYTEFFVQFKSKSISETHWPYDFYFHTLGTSSGRISVACGVLINCSYHSVNLSAWRVGQHSFLSCMF